MGEENGARKANSVFWKICSRIGIMGAVLASLTAIGIFSYRTFAEEAVRDTAKRVVLERWVDDHKPYVNNRVDSVAALVLSQSLKMQERLNDAISKVQCYQQASMTDAEMRRGERYYELQKRNGN